MRKMSNEFRALEMDNQSGSGTIVEKAIGSILQYYFRNSLVDSEKVVSNVLEILGTLASCHSQFGALHHLRRTLSDFWDNKKEPLTSRRLIDHLTGYRDEWKAVDLNLALEVSRHIELNNKRLLLHSKSSTLTNTFQHMEGQRWPAKIFQTESRPAFEGRRQAEMLLGLGLNVELIADTAVTAVANQLDMVLLGADAITGQYFVNKIGSYGIALLCREFGLPVYVLADSRKFMFNQTLEDEGPKASDEIWQNPPKSLAITNFYFERIPNNLVTGFITEASLENWQRLSSMTYSNS